MSARMKHPVLVLPEAMKALQAVSAAAEPQGLPPITRKLVHLRASQINGCGACVDMHARELRELGETSERLAAVAAWRETPYFSDAERAALALTEATTRLTDRSDAVSDAIWDEAARRYDERSLAALLIQIAMINAWNRLNIPIRQGAGSW